jgi:uncharacterized protein (TIGR00255 family)
MTAFARTQKNMDEGDLIWELRSVNHRYLELHLKMPDDFRVHEMKFREVIQKRLKRGKVECFLRFNRDTQDSKSVHVNHQQAKSLISACQEIKVLLVKVPYWRV